MMSQNSKAINMLYCGLSTDIYELVFHYTSAKDIWDYLCCRYGSNEEITDLEIITNEENGDDKSEPHAELLEKQDQEEHEFKKNIQDLSTPMSKENEVKNFSDNSSLYYLDFIDLNIQFVIFFQSIVQVVLNLKSGTKLRRKIWLPQESLSVSYTHLTLPTKRIV